MATIEQRGKAWRARIRRKNYSTQSATFDSKADAEKWVRKIEGKMDINTFNDLSEAEHTTLKDGLERYLKEVTPSKKGAAQETIRIKKWQKHPISRRSLMSLRSMDFAEERDARIYKGLKASTIRNDFGVISNLFNTAIKEWGMTGLVNPVKHIKKPSLPRGRERRLLPHEEKKLLAISNPILRAVITILIETGMRRGELCLLEWKNVDLHSRVARLIDSKNGESREVPLSTKAVKVFKTLASSRDKNELYNNRIIQFSPHTITHMFISACKKVNILDLRLHDLRHEATSRMVEGGKLNMIEIAAITGHKTMIMLRRYSHPKATEMAKKLG